MEAWLLPPAEVSQWMTTHMNHRCTCQPEHEDKIAASLLPSKSLMKIVLVTQLTRNMQGIWGNLVQSGHMDTLKAIKSSYIFKRCKTSYHLLTF